MLSSVISHSFGPSHIPNIQRSRDFASAIDRIYVKILYFVHFFQNFPSPSSPQSPCSHRNQICPLHRPYIRVFPASMNVIVPLPYLINKTSLRLSWNHRSVPRAVPSWTPLIFKPPNMLQGSLRVNSCAYHCLRDSAFLSRS